MESQEMQRQEKSQRGRKSASLLLLLILLVTVTVGFAVLSTTLNIKGESKIVGEWCVGPECDSTCTDAEDPDCEIIECPASEKCEITDCVTHPDHCTCEGGVSTPDPIDCTQNPDKSDPTKCNCNATSGVCTPVPQIWLDGNTVYFKHVLRQPTEVFTFNTKYTNGGTIDAKVQNVSKSALNATAQQFMTYDVTYADDTVIASDDALNAGTDAKFKVTVTYKDVTTLPTEAQLALINETAQGHDGATSSFSVNYEQK